MLPPPRLATPTTASSYPHHRACKVKCEWGVSAACIVVHGGLGGNRLAALDVAFISLFYRRCLPPYWIPCTSDWVGSNLRPTFLLSELWSPDFQFPREKTVIHKSSVNKCWVGGGMTESRCRETDQLLEVHTLNRTITTSAIIFPSVGRGSISACHWNDSSGPS